MCGFSRAPLLTRVEHQAFQHAFDACIRAFTHVARRNGKTGSDHEGEVTTMHLHRLHSASVAHPYAVTTYPSKYTRVSTCTSINALAPSHLRLFAAPISLIYLSFMNSLSLFLSIFLFSSAFLSLARYIYSFIDFFFFF